MTRKGTLTFDEKKFTAALEKNFDDVVALISGDGTSFGVIPKLGRAIASLSAPGTGLLSSQKKNFDNQIQTINKNIDRTEKIAEAKAKSLKESLSRAQAAVQAIQSQGGAIANSVSSAIPSVNSQ
jgi:flagellar capping protein FliD